MVGVTILLTSHHLHVVQEVTGFVVTKVGMFGLQSFLFSSLLMIFTLSLVFSDPYSRSVMLSGMFFPFLFCVCVC